MSMDALRFLAAMTAVTVGSLAIALAAARALLRALIR